MRNPLRSEAEAYRLLWIVIACSAAIIVAAFINTWLGVAVASPGLHSDAPPSSDPACGAGERLEGLVDKGLV